eukprot:14240050-Alexandrium_andersonii.AAC.1
MSASLVGSEMCIRDSARPSVHGRTGTRGGSATSCAGVQPSSHGPEYPRCLLYTSDAADDM